MKPYECKECEGEGVVKDPEEFVVECKDCRGSGLDWVTLSCFIERLVDTGELELRKEDL